MTSMRSSHLVSKCIVVCSQEHRIHSCTCFYILLIHFTCLSVISAEDEALLILDDVVRQSFMSQSTTESSSQCDDELYVRETLFYYVCILLELNILLTFIHLCKFIGSHLLCVLSTMGKQA